MVYLAVPRVKVSTVVESYRTFHVFCQDFVRAIFPIPLKDNWFDGWMVGLLDGLG